MKQLLTVALTLVLTIGLITPVQASVNTSPRNESQMAGYVLTDAMGLVLTQYIGTHITVDHLMIAALSGMFDVPDRRHLNMNEADIDAFIHFGFDRLNGSDRILADVIDLIIDRYRWEYLTASLLLDAALHGISEILDEYSYYLSEAEFDRLMDAMYGRLTGIGVTLTIEDDGRVRISHVLPDSPAQDAEIFPGDILISVEGTSVTGMSIETIISLITGSETGWVRVGVERSGRPHTFNIQKAEIHIPTVIVDRLESIPEASGLGGLSGFRYMHINSIGINTGDDVRLALAQMRREGVRGLVLDLRYNAGGSLEVTIDIANQLVPQGAVLQRVNPDGSRRLYSSTLVQAPFERIVVIVNRYTASGAEVIASALQDAGAAVLVGETTFGKGSVQSVFGLENNGVMVLTTAEYFRRSGGIINGIGVVPCVVINPESVVYGGHDVTLRRGLEILISGQ